MSPFAPRKQRHRRRSFRGAKGDNGEGDDEDLTENAIRLAYAERLEAVFNAQQHKNMTLALQAGSRAVVYCVQAEAWDRLGEFASGVVTSTSDPQLLEGLIPHLRTAADSLRRASRAGRASATSPMRCALVAVPTLATGASPWIGCQLKNLHGVARQAASESTTA